MKLMRGVNWVVLLVALALTSAAPAVGSQGQRTWDSYRILIERNIFSRNRRSPTQEVRETAPAPAPPERFIVLTGVARRGAEHVAFLEDARTGNTKAVKVGDNVLEGRIRNMTLDMIEYEKGEETVTIGIGGNLEGSKASATGGESYRSDAGDAPVAGTEEAEILERLRQQREKELGK